MSFIQIADLVSDINQQEKVIFLLRHAERHHITKEDMYFGSKVGLTQEGKAQSYKLGTSIPSTGKALYFSSPVGRCKETASIIANGRGDTENGNAKIEVIESLGNYFVKDFDLYIEALKNDFYQQLISYLEKGRHPAFLPLKETSEQMIKMILGKSTAQWNFFLSHDAWIIPCLKNFLNMDFTSNCWINFLSGLAIIVSPSGTKFYPVTALKEGYLYY